MINVLSYIGMTEHSEVCLWTLLGLVRTIFDATLFRVNANLKQVWQMTMPEELSMPVQRVLRTMISGVMLVQCFTVYVYLASYIVLLYPVFLEERHNLVLPWLLLAAVRQLLCELTSLALGLGTCVLLGPARPPCIKFVVIKLVSIMPAFYMWMLLFSYYHTLKVAAAFKRFPTVLQSSDRDYGLELAIRRRRTKSLLGEEQLRSKLVASLYGERHAITGVVTNLSKIGVSSRMAHSTDTSITDFTKEEVEAEALQRNSAISHRMSETGSYEDWFGSEVVLPRGSDRILEQFVLMLLRIRACLDKKDVNGISSQMLNKSSHLKLLKYDNLNCSSISTDDSDTPLLVGSSKENTSSYLRDYPQIFMKKNSVEVPRTENTITLQTRQESDDTGSVIRTRKRSVMISKKEMITLEVDKIVSHRKYTPEVKKQQRKPSQTKNTSSIKTLNEVKINDRNMGVLMKTDNTTLHSVDNTPNTTLNEAKINDEAVGVLIKTDNSTLLLDPIKTENNDDSNESQQSIESVAFEIKDVNGTAGYSKRNMNHDNVKCERGSHKTKESTISTANDMILEESSSSTKNNDELLKQPFSTTKNNDTNKSEDEKTKKVRDNK